MAGWLTPLVFFLGRNTLACGPFPSKMMKSVLETSGDAIAEANPTGRIGTPEDAAGACLFLCGRAG